MTLVARDPWRTELVANLCAALRRGELASAELLPYARHLQARCRQRLDELEREHATESLDDEGSAWIADEQASLVDLIDAIDQCVTTPRA